nr:PREDICTED: cell division cycle protein 20 homolog isoform X2 [Megachile rotundata]
MSHLKYMKEINNLTRMDEAIKGPLPRWQKKCLESSNSSINLSVNSSRKTANASFANVTTGKTPTKKNDSRTKKTPSKGSKKSPSRTSALTKTPNGGDRFIPSRSTTNFDLGYYKIQQANAEKDEEKVDNTSPSKREMQRLIDLNLVDWSENNILAVALGANVYLWNAASGTIEQLFELEGNDYVCSVAWIQEGPYLAVGTTVGNTELWDCSQMKRVRVMNGHAVRVGSLAWNSYVLTSGCRAGQIVHHDVRQRDHLISTINAHAQEVCGLKWSPDGKYLASGGNDNMLQIWPSISGQSHTHTQPIYSLNQHQAAVKALAWCPWQNNILASGGGTADRSIRFWNCNTGACLNTIDTKSQVCSLLWSTTYKEIVSGHGYAQNQLTIWKYPAMTKVAELTGHSSRVLHLAMSPDGTTVLSAGADETLRLWKCFQPDPHKKKETNEIKSVAYRLKQSIR